MEQNNVPLVSICTLVYNHEPYLRECFEGFLMQKTNFAFEVLVHDDASIDNSAEIIREYTENYPDIFKPIYQKENQYSKGVKVNATYQFPRSKGKYIAICEGDDYWTDPLKLQKQVDFMETHPDYVICSHRFKIFKQEENRITDDWYGNISEGTHYDLNALINGKWYFQPLTVMFRAETYDLKEYNQYSNSKDSTLFFYLLKHGKGYMLPEEMGVYRHHAGGVWSCIRHEDQLTGELKTRLGIYEIEESYEAAFYLHRLFLSWIPSNWMLREWKLMIKSFKIISKFFGITLTYKLFMQRFIPTRIQRCVKRVLIHNSTNSAKND